MPAHTTPWGQSTGFLALASATCAKPDLDLTETVQDLTAEDWVAYARELHPALGDRQAQVLAEVAKVHPAGTGTGPIWRAINYEQTNTYLALDALARHGLVRKDSTAKPHRYYLGAALLRHGQTSNPMAESLESRYETYVLAGIAALKDRYSASDFRLMVHEHGAVWAAHRLLDDRRHRSYGFQKLYELGELERSIEFAALLPWFSSLFSNDELREAETRLALHDFPWAERLEVRSASPPSWTDS